MNTRLVAVDPGSSSGAIAIWDSLGMPGEVVCLNMPNSPKGIYNFFKGHLSAGRYDVICEDVGAGRPGNSARSSHTFAVHRGHLDMVFIALGIPVTWVRPQKWMKELLGKEYPKGSANLKARKDYIYLTEQMQWPKAKFTKRQADALAILDWALRKQEEHT